MINIFLEIFWFLLTILCFSGYLLKAKPSENGEDSEGSSTNVNQARGTSTQNTGELYKRAVCGYSLRAFRSQQQSTWTCSALERRIYNTLEYIEDLCKSKYGFVTQVSSESSMQHSELGIYQIYDSAFIIDALCDAGFSLCSGVRNSVETLLLENRNQRSGLWNYFLPDYQLIPADADTSSVSVSALLHLGISPGVAEKMGKNIYNKAVFHPDGLLDVYFRKQDSEVGEGFGSSVFENWPVRRRVDVSVTANFLVLQEKIRNCSDKLLPSYKLVNRFMQAIWRDDLSNPVVTQYAKCYTNLDLILYLISRISNSKMISEETLHKILKKRLLMDNANPISISCRILAAIKCGLHIHENGRKQLTLEVQNLLNLQRSDFSYQECAWYNAHNTYHFGSIPVSTSLGLCAIFQAFRKIPHLERDLHLAF